MTRWLPLSFAQALALSCALLLFPVGALFVLANNGGLIALLYLALLGILGWLLLSWLSEKSGMPKRFLAFLLFFPERLLGVERRQRGLKEIAPLVSSFRVYSPKIGALKVDLRSNNAELVSKILGARRSRLSVLGVTESAYSVGANGVVTCTFFAPRAAKTVGARELRLAKTARGEWVTLPILEAGHIVLQGMTRFGKSVAAYRILFELGRSGIPSRVVGVDGSGALLRPYEDKEPALISLSADTEDALLVSEGLEKLLEDRLAALRSSGRDKVEISPEIPLIVVVYEEYLGVLERAKNADKKAAAKISSVFSRLLAEGHKAGFRVIALAQKALISELGSVARSNFGVRLSFRCESPEQVALLHPSVDSREVFREMSEFEPGDCLVEIAGFLAPTVCRVEYLPYRVFAGAA